jgi:CheY-like chemotaxis protein
LRRLLCLRGSGEWWGGETGDTLVSGRVLIVDGHAAFRQHLSLYLTLLDGGYTVVGECGTGREALERLGTLAPDIALIEVGLPDGNGLFIARYIRRASPATAVIVLGDNVAADYRPAALDAGAVECVDKLQVIERLPPALAAIGGPARVGAGHAQWRGAGAAAGAKQGDDLPSARGGEERREAYRCPICQRPLAGVPYPLADR